MLKKSYDVVVFCVYFGANRNKTENSNKEALKSRISMQETEK